MQDLEQKRKRIEALVKVGGLLVIGFFVAPVIFISIKGLIGLVLAAGVSFTALNFVPWYAAKVANWRLKAIKHEASKNPIETLQNEYRARQEALSKFELSIKAFGAEVLGFKEKLIGFKKTYPSEAERFDAQFHQMQALLNSRKEKYKLAHQNLSVFDGEINKARAIWEMAQAAAAMNRLAGVNEEEFYAKIQVETALDSVQKSMSIAFSDLEVSLLEEPMIKPEIEQERKNKERIAIQ